MSYKITDIINLIDFASMESTDECQRLFHGRGHAYEGLSHVNIDWLAPVILISLYQQEDQVAMQQLATDLKAKFSSCLSVQVQKRYLKNSPFEVLLGDDINDTIVSEYGIKYHIQLGKAQNTGLFLDMRNGRQWVRQHASGKKVLNLFAYTCAFSVAALAGGATHVVNIDNNKGVLTRGRENHRLNALDTKRLTFEGVNIFQSYSRLKKHGPYDMLICDPPTYQAGSVDIKRDYKKIISRIPQFMNAGSQLMLCLNSPNLAADYLLDTVAENCADCEYVETIANPSVYKEAMAGRGLKVLDL